MQQADLYAGGFGARFTGRLSSVVDIATRNGNDRQFAGAVTASPFLSGVRLEGPLATERASFLLSGRESMVERAASRYVGEELPFAFGDAFARVHAVVTKSIRISATALRTHDRGTLGKDFGGAPPDEIRWKNQAAGFRMQFLPKAFPAALNLHVSHSRFRTELTGRDSTSRTSQVKDTRMALDATFYGARTTVDAGWQLDVLRIQSHLEGLFQNVAEETAPLSPSGLYVDPDFDVGGGFHVRPGMRVEFYGVRFDPYFEPRLRVRWDRGVHHVSVAAGLYHQEVLGLNDRRDAASVFTVWTRIPRTNENDPPVLVNGEEDVRQGRLGTAYHAIVGYRVNAANGLEGSVEGYYKYLSNLFIGEWTALPRLTTSLQPAFGRTVGADARMEYRRGAFYGFLNYGLSSTLYWAEQPEVKLWYGTEALRFRPPHDRRHQVNVLVSSRFHGIDYSVRWEFGSGLPFSRAVAFDGFVLLDDVKEMFGVERSRRVIYEHPYQGLLPTYHRLDVSAEHTFTMGRAAVTVQGSLINMYDRRNLFYLDVFTLRRADQLPFVPSLGLKVAFD